MNSFRIFTHPSGHIDAIKQGWSWLACFFGFIAGTMVFLSVLDTLVPPEDMYGVEGAVGLVGFVVGIVSGMNANRWRERRLLARGYQASATIQAASASLASSAFLKSKAAGGQMHGHADLADRQRHTS